MLTGVIALFFFYTDNEAIVHVINEQSCKDKLLMVFVHQMVLLCLKFNILFKAKHITGVKNNLADALSRLQVQKFRQLAPASMDRSPADMHTSSSAPRELVPKLTHLLFPAFSLLLCQHTGGHGNCLCNFIVTLFLIMEHHFLFLRLC